MEWTEGIGVDEAARFAQRFGDWAARMGVFALGKAAKKFRSSILDDDCAVPPTETGRFLEAAVRAIQGEYK